MRVLNQRCHADYRSNLGRSLACRLSGRSTRHERGAIGITAKSALIRRNSSVRDRTGLKYRSTDRLWERSGDRARPRERETYRGTLIGVRYLKFFYGKQMKVHTLCSWGRATTGVYAKRMQMIAPDLHNLPRDFSLFCMVLPRTKPLGLRDTRSKFVVYLLPKGAEL